MKKWLSCCIAAVLAGGLYSMSCLLCIANGNDVSEEEYARMAQELVEQSIERPTPAGTGTCTGPCI